MRLDQYSSEQQEAIGRLLRPEGVRFSIPSESAGFAGARAPGDESDARTMIELAMAEISSRTGREYVGRIEITLVDRPEVSRHSWAKAIASTALGGIDGWIPFQNGPTASATCHIFFGQRAISAPASVAYEKVAHEVFHCFQYQGFRGTSTRSPRWGSGRSRGSAAWVGLSLSGGAANSQAHS